MVGAGATGVETAGATAELLRAFSREGHLRRSPQVVLVDRGTALLPQFSDKAHHYAYEKLTQAGVQVRLGVGVAGVRTDGVDLDDGSGIATRTVVWAGGEAAADIVQAAGVQPGHGGRIDVAPDLRVPGLPGVYAVGDVANIPAGADALGGAALPQLGSVAQQAGRWAAPTSCARSTGKDPEPFRYKDKGIMAMIGRNAAVAEVGRHRHQVEGPLAFAAWLGVHAMLLVRRAQQDRRVPVLGLGLLRPATTQPSSRAEAAGGAPGGIAWGDDDGDVPHIRTERAGPSADGSAPPDEFEEDHEQHELGLAVPTDRRVRLPVGLPHRRPGRAGRLVWTGCACRGSTAPACSAACSTGAPGTSGSLLTGSTCRRPGRTSREPTSSSRPGTRPAAGSRCATRSRWGRARGRTRPRRTRGHRPTTTPSTCWSVRRCAWPAAWRSSWSASRRSTTAEPPATWTLADAGADAHTADATGAGVTVRLHSDLPLGVEGNALHGRHVLGEGDRVFCALSWSSVLDGPADCDDAARRLVATA